jgi:hypothetical protein
MSDETVLSVDPERVVATTPFKALLAASSLFAVVLGIAGFSLRWNYYYNFGLQDIVIEAPLSSLAVSSIEIIRSPENVATLLLMIVEFLLPLQLILIALRRLARADSPRVRRSVEAVMQFTGLGSDLFVDVVRAGLILFVAFRTGAVAGSRDYLTNVVESTSRLARVTVIAPPAEAPGKPGALLVTCDPNVLLSTPQKATPSFVGSSNALDRLNGGAACSTGAQSWRLLYRDEKYVYIFLTVEQAGRRPDMLALPRGEGLALVLQ